MVVLLTMSVNGQLSTVLGNLIPQQPAAPAPATPDVVYDMPNTVTTIKCAYDFLVKVRTTDPYKLKDCTMVNNTDNELWSCPCLIQNTAVVLLLPKETSGVYDVVIEYYLEMNKTNETKRTDNINNLKLDTHVKKEPDQSLISKSNKLMAFIFFIGLGLIVIIGIVLFFAYRYLIADDEIVDNHKHDLNLYKKETDEKKVNKIKDIMDEVNKEWDLNVN